MEESLFFLMPPRRSDPRVSFPPPGRVTQFFARSVGLFFFFFFVFLNQEVILLFSTPSCHPSQCLRAGQRDGPGLLSSPHRDGAVIETVSVSSPGASSPSEETPGCSLLLTLSSSRMRTGDGGGGKSCVYALPK